MPSLHALAAEMPVFPSHTTRLISLLPPLPLLTQADEETWVPEGTFVGGLWV